MSTEFIKDGIRVNAVNCGFVLTPDWIKTATQLTAGTGRDWKSYIDDLARENAPIGRFASPEEVADFVSHSSSSPSLQVSQSAAKDSETRRLGDWEKKYEAKVDELLASPHYGERWGRYWLDVVRYAETCGYERDRKSVV